MLALELTGGGALRRAPRPLIEINCLKVNPRLWTNSRRLEAEHEEALSKWHRSISFSRQLCRSLDVKKPLDMFSLAGGPLSGASGAIYIPGSVYANKHKL